MLKDEIAWYIGVKKAVTILRLLLVNSIICSSSSSVDVRWTNIDR